MSMGIILWTCPRPKSLVFTPKSVPSATFPISIQTANLNGSLGQNLESVLMLPFTPSVWSVRKFYWLFLSKAHLSGPGQPYFWVTYCTTYSLFLLWQKRNLLKCKSDRITTLLKSQHLCPILHRQIVPLPAPETAHSALTSSPAPPPSSRTGRLRVIAIGQPCIWSAIFA